MGREAHRPCPLAAVAGEDTGAPGVVAGEDTGAPGVVAGEDAGAPGVVAGEDAGAPCGLRRTAGPLAVSSRQRSRADGVWGREAHGAAPA